MIMRGWLHIFSIAAGIAAPVAITLWSTSDFGVRSRAHYAAVEQQSAERSMSARDVVMAFDKLAFGERKPREAVLRYVAAEAVDHHQDIRGDRQSMIEMLERKDWSGTSPRRTIRHVVAEGDLVVVHHHLVRQPGTPGIAAVDMFRVKDGRIVEHWDVLQPIAANSPNRADPF